MIGSARNNAAALWAGQLGGGAGLVGPAGGHARGPGQFSALLIARVYVAPACASSVSQVTVALERSE